MRHKPMKFLAALAALALVAAACGGDSEPDTTAAAAPTTTAAAPTTTEAAPATTAAAPATTAAAPATTEAAPATTEAAPPDWGAADFNGDGAVRLAVIMDGPRDDGAYYQALVEQVEEISRDGGYEDPLVVDQVDPAESRSELENLVAQSVDVVAIGSSSLADGNHDLFLEHEEIFWYCNCGSGYQDTEGLLRSADSGVELNISGGYATGLLMQERGGTSAVFIGCCELNFEVESFLAFEYGLKLVDESFEATYVPTGNFPFDFNNTAGATEAYNNAVAEGASAVYPFLGGAHEPIVALANEDGLIVMTAGPSNGCERTDLDYDLEIKFDAGDYLEPIFTEILNGTAEEAVMVDGELAGGIRYFKVGVDPEVGAELCGAADEQVQMLADLNARIGADEFAEKTYEILSTAYGF